MLLRLPPNLHYPITITRIEKQSGDTINLNDNLFLYSYITKVKQGNRHDDEEEIVDKKFVAHLPSTLEGTIQSWKIREGDVVQGPVDACTVEEECPHSVQFLGMCTNCGKDMTEVQSGGIMLGTARANIQAAHDTDKLTISVDEANKLDEESKRRLLATRKLSLVVDLDQTIIHAAVDPTIAEWQKDKDNPNWFFVKDVRSFQLIDDGPGMRGCWYYIKLRPGLEEFLESVAEKYELHIYTMGTRQYAQQIANIVDPHRKYFADRILSRDESGSMVAKNLTRIFPVDTKMVVIIDDRGDVWKWSPNLIRVTPFDFFVGIGDINSSFLPKKEEIQSTTKVDELKDNTTSETNGSKKVENGDHIANGEGIESPSAKSSTDTDTSALQQLVAMSGGDSITVQELQSKGQEEVIVSQMEQKPLSRLQQQLDEKDEAEAEAATSDEQPSTQATEPESSESESSPSQPVSKHKGRHSVLRNDDEELLHLEASLHAVHERFYAEYDRKRLAGKGGRVAALTGKRKAPLPDTEDDAATDLQMVPDIKKVMPAMKSKVLGGVTIVFSGVLPLGTDILNADIVTWARSFGATISDKVSREVTHVIAARVGTAKVKQAVKRGIKVVSTNWLMDSIQRWRKLDERPYLLPGIGQKGYEDDRSSEVGTHDILDDRKNITPSDFLLSSSDEETTGFEDTEDERPLRKKLKIDVARADAAEDDPNFIDDGSPVTLERDDWDDMDAEFKEFMGEDIESESDTDSVRSSLSFREQRAIKRRRADNDDETDSDSDQHMRAVKRQSGGSTLRAVKNADSTAGNTPVSNGQAVDADGGGDVGEDERDEDTDEELARELERELDEADTSL